MQDEHLHLGARIACRERLPVRPHPEDGVAGARVVLGDDQDLHDQLRCVASVRWASEALIYGRPARNRWASAIASRRSYAAATWRMPWRTGIASSTPILQPCWRASAPQCASRPQPTRSGGNGSSSSNVELWRPTTGPISTYAVSRTRLPARRRVTCQAACERARWAGCARRRPNRSARNTNASRKYRGNDTSSSTISSQSLPRAG